MQLEELTMIMKLRFSLLLLLLFPVFASGGIDLSIMEEPGATASGTTIVVKGSSNMGPSETGAILTNLRLSDPTSAGMFPVDIDVDSAAFPTLGGFGATHDGSGIQSNVGDGDLVTVVGLLGNITLDATPAELFRVHLSFDNPSFVDGASFKVSIVGDGTEIGDIALSGASVASTVISAPAAVPEPSSFILLGLAAVGFVGKRYYSKKKTEQ